MTNTKKSKSTLGIRSPFAWILAILVLLMFLLSWGSQAGLAAIIPFLIMLELSTVEWVERWCSKGNRNWSLWRLPPVFLFAIIFALCLFGMDYSETKPVTDQLKLVPLWSCFGFLMAIVALALKEDLSVANGAPIKLDRPLLALSVLALIGAVVSMLWTQS